MVGLAQVNGRRDINVFKKINYDLEYVKCVSFILDLKIIIKSFHIIISKEDDINIKGYVSKEVEDLKVSNGDIYF